MTPGKKYTLATSVFYGLLLALLPLLDHASNGDPCNPGTGLLLLMMIPLVSGLAFVICFAVRAKGNRAFMGPAIINGILFLASLILLWHVF